MKNTQYKHGSFKSGENSIVISDSTKESDIIEFLKNCDKGTANAIKRGVSSEAIAMRAKMKEGVKKTATSK